MSYGTLEASHNSRAQLIFQHSGNPRRSENTRQTVVHTYTAQGALPGALPGCVQLITSPSCVIIRRLSQPFLRPAPIDNDELSESSESHHQCVEVLTNIL